MSVGVANGKNIYYFMARVMSRHLLPPVAIQITLIFPQNLLLKYHRHASGRTDGKRGIARQDERGFHLPRDSESHRVLPNEHPEINPGKPTAPAGAGPSPVLHRGQTFQVHASLPLHPTFVDAPRSLHP